MLDLNDADMAVTAVAGGNETHDEALAALMMLGFTKTASEKVLGQILKADPAISVEEAVRDALKRL